MLCRRLHSTLVTMHKAKVPTPHINAKAGDFAETVLMPGGTQRFDSVIVFAGVVVC
jgi:hypothetical protein